MRLTATVSLALAMLSLAGCWPMPRAEATLPDPQVGHRLAKPTDLDAWVRRPDGTLTQEHLHVPAGWYVFAPDLIEGKP